MGGGGERTKIQSIERILLRYWNFFLQIFRFKLFSMEQQAKMKHFAAGQNKSMI